MASTEYTRSIQNDFPNHKVDPSRFTREIQASSITIALDYINTSGDNCNTWFKDTLDAPSLTEFDVLVAAHSGEPLPSPITADGVPIVSLDSPKDQSGITLIASQLKTEDEISFVTHNFADPCTWYSASVRVTDEALTDSGDHLTWGSENVNWIDMTHGRTFDEDRYAEEYEVIITSDGTAMVQRLLGSTTGGDYEVDFEAGTVTFFVSQEGKAVVATYSRANGSDWILQPTTGKLLEIEKAEAQFSSDVEMNDTIDFEIWVYNPADLPNKVLYGRTSYKTMRNMIDDAIGCYPEIPPMGGSDRGTLSSVYGFPFYYASVRKLQSGVGAELRIRLRDNKAFAGEFCTATFYCTSHTEE